MTTIAVDGVIFASDSRETTTDGQIGIEPVQKIFQRSGVIIGISGEVSCQPQLLDWAVKGEGKPPEFLEGTEWEILRHSKNGLEYHANDCNDWVKTPFPASIGTGQTYALSAMLLGKNASEAVDFAISMDCFSGGGVQVIKLPKSPKLKAI